MLSRSPAGSARRRSISWSNAVFSSSEVEATGGPVEQAVGRPLDQRPMCLDRSGRERGRDAAAADGPGGKHERPLVTEVPENDTSARSR